MCRCFIFVSSYFLVVTLVLITLFLILCHFLVKLWARWGDNFFSKREKQLISSPRLVLCCLVTWLLKEVGFGCLEFRGWRSTDQSMLTQIKVLGAVFLDSWSKGAFVSFVSHGVGFHWCFSVSLFDSGQTLEAYILSCLTGAIAEFIFSLLCCMCVWEHEADAWWME